MDIKPETKLETRVNINKLLEELNSFVSELEQQVKNNTYPLKPTINGKELVTVNHYER